MLRRLSPISLVLCLAACSLVAPKFNRPNVSVVNVEMRGGNLWEQNFTVKLNVQKPNDRALPVSGLHVELNAGGEGSRAESATVPSSFPPSANPSLI